MKTINISNIEFLSDDHVRFEDGRAVVSANTDANGHNKGAKRLVKVEPDINGLDGYTVTIFNMDGNHPLWGNNVQMAPKQMKVIAADTQKVTLRGYGFDSFGGSFADYGLTIYHDGQRPTKLRMHMHDRNIDIEYYTSSSRVSTTEFEQLAKKINDASINGQRDNASQIRLLNLIKSNPRDIASIVNLAEVGKSFIHMIHLTDDIDTQQLIASVGYLVLSLAIEKNPHDVNAIKDRCVIILHTNEPFRYTVKYPLNIGSSMFMFGSSNWHFEARDAIFQMEISDLENNPILYQQLDFLAERRKELLTMVKEEFFLPNRTIADCVRTGMQNHEKVFAYLKERILEEGDVDF